MLQLFCSHSWDHSDHRDGLHGLISPEWERNRHWRDLAVPREHPLHVHNDSQLAGELVTRIALSDVIVAFAGMYCAHSAWIEFEVNNAWLQQKPIVAVIPRAQQRLSSLVMERAAVSVGWNGKSVREAILQVLPAPRWGELEPILRQAERTWPIREVLKSARR